MDQRERPSKFELSRVGLRTLSLGIKVALVIAVTLGLLFYWGFSQIPSNEQIRGCMVTKLYKVELCPGSPQYTKLKDISPFIQKAVVLTEDSTFWDHQGFDLQEMQNSLKSNLEKGRYARGGSTITQQLAKNLFLSKDKTLIRKLVEAVITVRLEKALSKKEILERYLNVVQFGKDLFGIKAASQFYFKKAPAQLSMVESAFLTFLLPNPEVYSKSYFKKQLTPFARKRLHTIVDRLYQYQRVSEGDYLSAKAELSYFLGGGGAPVIDPALDGINEEDYSTSEEFPIEEWPTEPAVDSEGAVIEEPTE